MQKIITVTIDVEQLAQQTDEPFSITDVGGINAILQEGWFVEEWEFLTDQVINGKVTLMFVLNDEEEWEEEDMDDDDFWGTTTGEN